MKSFKKTVALILGIVMMFSFASCSENKNTDTPNTLGAVAGTLSVSDFLDVYKENPDSHSNKIIGFGFTSEEFNEKFVKNGNWNTFNLQIEFGNTNDFGVTVFGVDVAENGKKGVFVSTAADAVIGLPANFTSTQDIYCKIIADAALSETDVIKTLGKMGITILFTNASNGAEELSEVPAGELLNSSIDFIL